MNGANNSTLSKASQQHHNNGDSIIYFTSHINIIICLYSSHN
jgi:hypothetical protein